MHHIDGDATSSCRGNRAVVCTEYHGKIVSPEESQRVAALGRVGGTSLGGRSWSSQTGSRLHPEEVSFDKGRNIRLVEANDAGWMRVFAWVEVRNVQSGTTAADCIGLLRLIRWPRTFVVAWTEFSVHWADVPYSHRSVQPEPISIVGQSPHRLNIAFGHPPPKRKTTSCL